MVKIEEIEGLKPIPVPLANILDCLPKEKKKEIYRKIINESIPDSPLIKEIITKGDSSKSLREILKEEGIELIE